MFSDKRQRSFHKAYHDITENEYRRASHKAISYLIDSFVVHSRVVDVSLYTTVYSILYTIVSGLSRI